MANLFPAEPGKSRREFARFVAAARAAVPVAHASKDEPAPAIDAAFPVEQGVLPGTRLRLIREIGGGASSVVHEAEHVDLGRRVAVKILTPEHGSSPEYAARFRREARAISRLAHDGIVQLHDFGRAGDGRLFCVMELLEGETVEALLARDRDIDWQYAVRIGLRVLGTLEVAHAAGVVHRDIKPANIFTTREGHIKVLDFGLAHTPEDIGEAALGAPNGDNAVAAGFTLFGTPEYMAPEQAAGGRVDGRADLYALGCVLYEMITGQLPYIGASAAAIVDSKMKGSPERPRDRVPAKHLPAAVDELLMKSLSRHPGLRFQTAKEMRDALLNVLAAPARARSRRRAAGFSALATVMAFAAVLFAGKANELGRLVPASLSLTAFQDKPALVAPESPEPPATPPMETVAEAPTEKPAEEVKPIEGMNAAEQIAAVVTDKPTLRSPGASRVRGSVRSAAPASNAMMKEPESALDPADNIAASDTTPVLPAPANDGAGSSEPTTQPAQLVANVPEGTAADKPSPDAPAAVAKAEKKPSSKSKLLRGNKDSDEQARLRRKRKTRMASKVGEGAAATKPAGKTK